MALHTADLVAAGAVAGPDVDAVTDKATGGGAAAVADPAAAARDRSALGGLLAGFLLTSAVGAMARILPDQFHAIDAAESGQSEIGPRLMCIFELAEDCGRAA
jgi:hypothetical protein